MLSECQKGRNEIYIYRYIRTLKDKLSYFIPAALQKKSDELRRCRILIGSSFSVGFLTLALAFVRFMSEGWASNIGWVFFFVSILMLSTPVILRLSRSVFIAGSMIPALGASTLIFMAVYEGGMESEAIYWFPFAPLIAAFFVNAFASIIFGLLMLAALTAIYLSQQSGMISQSPNPIEIVQFLKLMSATAAVIFGASVAWLYETSRRKSEAALRHSNSRTEAILSAIPDAMFLLNHKGQILETKTSAGKDMINSSTFISNRNDNTVFDLFSADDSERISTQLQRAISAGTVQVAEYDLKETGQHLSYEVRIVPTSMQEALMIIRDVTTQRNIERMKNEFLSTVSHELRTPLTAVIGYISLLTGGVIPGIPKQASEMLENTNRNAMRLNSLIDDLLDLQKISSGHLEYVKKNVDVGTFVENSVELNKGYASMYDVEIVFDNMSDKTDIWIDESRMHQVIANLISNAIKYSPSGEKVLVQVKKNNDHVIISVKDNGEGIPEEFHNHVFEKFTQSDSSNTRKVGGTGLGLNISKRIVEAHGGRIDFETQIGKGTTFSLYIPIVAS